MRLNRTLILFQILFNLSHLYKTAYSGVVMNEIETKVLEINGEKRIALFFSYNEVLISKLKQIEGIIWNNEQKFWHIAYRKDYLNILNLQFEGIITFSQSDSECSDMKKQVPESYLETLTLMNYSEATIKSYRLHFKRFLNYYPKHKIDDISYEQIKSYLLYLVKERHYSTSAQDQAINSIKFYYDIVLGIPIDKFYIPRPRKGRKTPKILSTNEVSSILNSIEDLKYKCMISLIYSAGLTPSEITYLKIRDINSQKMKIFISSPSKEGGRNVILSEKVLILLREYFRKYNPVLWLFERKTSIQCTQREIQKAFKAAVVKSKINKEATLTILRNSFAAHLIDNGIDIRFIQQMMGHKSAKTTMRYLSASKRDLRKIKSPLDNLEI